MGSTPVKIDPSTIVPSTPATPKWDGDFKPLATDPQPSPTQNPSLVKIDLSTFVPFDKASPTPIIPTQQERAAQQLQGSVFCATQQNPDSYARLLKLKQRTGLSPQIIHLNEAEVQQAADIHSLDYPQLVASHPRTAAWASNPDNAAVAGVDEIQRLAQLEKNAQALKESNFVMTPTGGVTLDPWKPIRDWLYATGDTIKRYIQSESMSLDPNDPENRLRGINYTWYPSTPGVPPAKMNYSEAETTRAYQNLVAPAGQAGTDFLTSQLQPENLMMLGAFSAIPTTTATGKALHAAIGGYFAGKMGSEGVVQAYEAYRQAEGGNVPDAVNKAVGAILNLGMAYEGGRGAAKMGAGVFHQNLEESVTSAERSKLRERSPESFSDATQQIFEGGPSLRIPVEQFETYFQSQKLDPEQVAQELGVKNYSEAKLSGGDVEVAPADFLNKLTPEHQKALLPDVVDPSTGRTPRQARAEQEVTPEQLQKLIQDAATADAETQASDEYQSVRSQLLQRYIDAGEKPNVADSYALLQANKITNLARGFGMQPTEVLQIFDPKVRIGEAPGQGLEQADRAGEQPRGWFRVMPDGSLEIGKTKIGDLSTFVHEPSHAYLYMLDKLMKERGGSASEALKGDFEKIKEFLGWDGESQITREQHEKWAKANEQYIREGIAPSQSLRKVFQRFAVWMSSVYKRASDLGVDLSPDIRGVFDRMYAAEEGVNRAEQESGPQLYTSAEEAGYTPEDFQRYAGTKGLEVEQAKAEILAKLNEAAIRERSDAWREEENTVRGAVATEIDAKPEYTAVRSLRQGSLDDGTELKLNRDELVKQFGEERVRELQKQHPGLYRNEGGLAPDVVAEILGFTSADHLMRALQAAPKRSVAIDQATREYMTAKHGDIRYDGTLDDQARVALENDKKAERLHKELTDARKRLAETKGLAAAQNAAIRDIQTAPLKAYRDAARNMIEGKAVADLNPTRYLDASRKYSREAFDALKRRDVQEASDAKHKELLNHFLFREATKAKEFVGTVETNADKIASPERQGDIGKGGQDFLAQVQSLLTKYKFVPGFKQTATAPAESLPDFLTRMRAEGQEMPIPDSVINGESTSYRNLSVEQLREVHAALTTLDHVARNINKITIEGRRVEETKVANDLDQALVDNVKGGERESGARVTDDAKSFLDRQKDKLGKLEISVLRPEFLFKRLDGLKDFGVWHDAFWNKYNDAHDHLTRLRESIYPQMLEIARGKWSKGLEEKIYSKTLDASLTKNDIFSMLLNSGNESNMDKLERGGIRFKVDGTSIPLTEDVRQKLFSHLTAEDIDKANQILKMISTLKPEVEALSIRRNGIAPQWIETRPYRTPNGTLEGGYFPVVYDPRWSAAGEKQYDSNSVDQMFNKYAATSTKQGYTKERTGFAAPLSLDWQAVVMRHLDNVMLDISHWQFVTEAQRLLKNPVVKESLISNIGENYQRNLMDWVRFTVNQDSMGREATDGLDKFRRAMRGNVGTAVLGYRIANAAVETAITPLLALQQAHPESVWKGMTTYMRNPAEATRFAEDASDYMKHINVEYDRQITEMWNDLRGRTSLLSDLKRWGILSRVALWKIGAVMSWHAGYLDAQRQGLDGDAAVRVADGLYRKIQEAGRAGDLSAVERDPYMRELTMFVGPTLIQYNNYMEAAHAIGDRGFTAQTTAKALTVFLAGHLVQTVLFDMMRGKGPDDEKKIPAWLAARLTLGTFDGVPIVSEGTRYLEKKALGEPGGEPRLIPVQQATKDTVDSIDKTLDAIHNDGRWFPQDKRSAAIKQNARTMGDLTGLPVNQPLITGEYVYDLFTGQYVPAHPWSYATDAFYARHKK